MRIRAYATPIVLLIGLLLALSLIATRVQPLLTPRLPQKEAISATSGYLDFAAPGPAYLDADALRVLGLDPQAETPPTLHLSWRATPLPVLPWRTAQGWALLFNVPAGATRYSPYTTLRWERDASSPTMLTQPAETPTGQMPSTAGRFLHLEQDNRYLTQATNEIPWFWQVLYTPGTFAPELNLTDWTSGPMSVTLRLWSHSSSATVNPDHLARLYWGEELIQEWSWDGTGMQVLSATWDAQKLAPLRLTNEAITDTIGVVWIDALDLRYTAPVRAGGSLWQADGDALRVDRATPETLALDVTDPLAPIHLHPWSPPTLRTQPGHRYWFGTPQQAQAPLHLRAMTPLVPPAPETSYLVIAPAAFHAALTPLLQARQAAGLQVALITPQAAYDAYGFGYPDPEALRALIASLPALRYVLLVGDASAAVDGYVGETGALRIVTPYVRTYFVGETPADGWLGADAEGTPRVAIGRWPAQSVNEVEVMVAKTLAWEEKGASQTLWLSDQDQEFAVMLSQLPKITPDLPRQTLDANASAAPQRLLELLNAGPTWVTYSGHGSLTQLSKTTLLSYKDTWSQPAVFVAWTCLAAYFIHPEQEGMGELWLRQPQGGVVAFFGPTGETTTPEQTPYAQAFYTALATQERVGDAWVEALRQGSSQDVRWSFILLGDPALRWQP